MEPAGLADHPDSSTAAPTRGVDDLLLDVNGKKNYTIQVGGAGGAGGPSTLKADFFPDTDGDGVLDDRSTSARRSPGIERFGGCPPELKVVPSIGFDGTASGITIKRLIVDRVPKGAKVVAKCSGCGSQTVKAKRFGRVSLTKLVGQERCARGPRSRSASRWARPAPAPTSTARPAATSTGRSRAGGLGARLTRCLNVKSSKIERCR